MTTEVVQADTTEAADDGGAARTVVIRRRRRPGWADLTLALVAVVYGVSQNQVWPAGLGWDESIYFSQVSGPHAAFFSAPRARGITWLAWPLAQFTESPHALRIYLSVISAIALYVVYRLWFRLVPPGAAVLAAVLFGGLWITRFYGAQLMPNLWVAFGAAAAVAGFLRLVVPADAGSAGPAREADDAGDRPRPDRVGLVALPAGLIVAALMRPSDAAWVAAALFGCALVVPAWRRVRLLGLIVAGGVLGAAPWVIEAFTRFGGIFARLRRASVIQGGLGWYPNLLGQHWKSIDGPLLCRPCRPPADPTIDMYWVPVLVVLLVAAILLARRSGRALMMATTIAAGGAMAVSYLLLVGYSAPRFLLPAYAVLAVPAAYVLYQVLAAALRPGPTRRRVLLGAASVAVVAAVAAQLVAQQLVIDGRATATMKTGRWYAKVADQLAGYGVQGPNCVVAGTQGPPVAYYTGCASRNVGGHDGSITAAGLRKLAEKYPVAVVDPDQVRPDYALGWTRHRLKGAPAGKHWTVYVHLPQEGTLS